MTKAEFENLMASLEIEPRFDMDDVIKTVENGTVTEYYNGKSNVYVIKGIILVHTGGAEYVSVKGKIPLSIIEEIQNRDPKNYYGIWCNPLEKRIFNRPTFHSYATHDKIKKYKKAQKLDDDDYIYDTSKYKKTQKRISEMRKELISEDYDNMYIESLIVHTELGLRDLIQTLKKTKTARRRKLST